MTLFAIRGPKDDWDPQALEEEEALGNLAGIDAPLKDEKEIDEEGEPKAVEEETEDEMGEVDELKALDRLEKQLKKEDELNLDEMEEE